MKAWEKLAVVSSQLAAGEKCSVIQRSVFSRRKVLSGSVFSLQLYEKLVADRA